MCNLVLVCIKTQDCSDIILVITKLLWALCTFLMIEGRNARDQLDPMHLIHLYQWQSKGMLAAYEPRMQRPNDWNFQVNLVARNLRIVPFLLHHNR